MSSRRGCEVGGRAQGLEPFTSTRSACGSPAFPAHVELGMAVRAAGLKSISIAVDERGLRVERPNESDPRAVLILGYGAMSEATIAEVIQRLASLLHEGGSIDFTKSLVAAGDHLALLPAHSVTADVSKGTIRLARLVATDS